MTHGTPMRTCQSCGKSGPELWEERNECQDRCVRGTGWNQTTCITVVLRHRHIWGRVLRHLAWCQVFGDEGGWFCEIVAGPLRIMSWNSMYLWFTVLFQPPHDTTHLQPHPFGTMLPGPCNSQPKIGFKCSSSNHSMSQISFSTVGGCVGVNPAECAVGKGIQPRSIGACAARALAPARQEVHDLQQNVLATQPCRGMCPGGPGTSICFVLRDTFMRKSDKIRTCFDGFATYTPFGNSMRSLALLRLVAGKDLWKSARAASRWRFGRHVLEHWYVYLHCRFGI